jgi:phage terminase Nu1 subunit (DNA packaging protein)
MVPGDAESPAPAQEPSIVATAEEVARAFGKSYRQVMNWKKDEMPVLPDGRYDLDAIRAWRESRAGRGGRERRTDREESEYWQGQFRKLKCQLLEQELRLASGELLDRGVEEANTMEVVRNFRDELLSIPPSIAPQLVGLDALTIKAVLDARLRDSLSNLAAVLGAPAEEAAPSPSPSG